MKQAAGRPTVGQCASSSGAVGVAIVDSSATSRAAGAGERRACEPDDAPGEGILEEPCIEQ